MRNKGNKLDFFGSFRLAKARLPRDGAVPGRHDTPEMSAWRGAAAGALVNGTGTGDGCKEAATNPI